MNFWFLWMPNSTREMTLGWWPWTELLGDPSLPCSASACGVCARAHTGVRVCARGCDEQVTHLLVGMTAVMGDLSSKCSIIYPNEIVGRQKGVLPIKSGWSSQTSSQAQKSADREGGGTVLRHLQSCFPAAHLPPQGPPGAGDPLVCCIRLTRSRMLPYVHHLHAHLKFSPSYLENAYHIQYLLK